MKIALAQISPHLGDVRKNFDLHLQYIEKAKNKNVDLLIFPELSLTGYTLKDLVEDVALSPYTNPLFKKLKAESRKVSLVFGFVEEKEKGLFYNSAAFYPKEKFCMCTAKFSFPHTGCSRKESFSLKAKIFTLSVPPMEIRE